MPKYTRIHHIQADLAAHKITCSALVEYYLQQIQTTASLNAYVEVFAEEARQRAAVLDKKYQDTPDAVGKLFGMVVSIKDVLCYKNHRVTAASKILEDFTSLYSATAVERLLAQDAIIIGRTNCDQFGMGSTTENSIYGATKNGIDPSRVAGGSSGGSAVAVQTDTCLVSLGTDTGGSVRQPANFCGIIGLKPTYGRVSRHGLLSYASSFDQIGVLSHSIEDTALVLEVIAGSDTYDSTLSSKPVPTYSAQLDFDKKARIAYFDTAIEHPSMDSEIQTQTKQVLSHLSAQGHTVEAASFDYLDYLVPAYYVLTTAEASSNLSRYDGVRYGYRSPEAKSLDEMYKKSRTEGFSIEVKRRILLGTFVLSAGYYDAYYAKAQKVRRLIQQQTLDILQNYDFILQPVSPHPPQRLGETLGDPVSMYLADIFTVQANMTGIPALAFPIGQHSSGMPMGIQLMGAPYTEGKLLAFGKYLLENLPNIG